jgi:hypothetical protein
VRGVERGSEEAGVDGSGDELFEGARGWQVEGGLEVLVGQAGVGAGEG